VHVVPVDPDAAVGAASDVPTDVIGAALLRPLPCSNSSLVQPMPPHRCHYVRDGRARVNCRARWSDARRSALILEAHGVTAARPPYSTTNT